MNTHSEPKRQLVRATLLSADSEAEERRHTRNMIMQLLGLTPGLSADEHREVIESSFALAMTQGSANQATEDDQTVRGMLRGLLVHDDASDAQATQALEDLLEACADDEVLASTPTRR